MPSAAQRRLRRGAYVLPSLFTFGNILLGFYAVVCAFHGHFVTAAWMIIAAGIADGLDGRIARLTHTESEFGKEFDSLADVLTFGSAPAYIVWLWALEELGRAGWLVPLYFLLCTAVRLARFNVQTKKVDSRSFVGLPSPAAAGTVASLLFLHAQIPDIVTKPWLAGVMLTALIVLGTLMVSTFRYPSMKKIDLRRRWSYRAALLFGVALLVLFLEPVIFFQLFAACYVAWGPLAYVGGRLRRRIGTGAASTDDGTEPTGEPLTE
ncbi:MAG: CDP-diacylglycerol--serine O-phosphatidyltransferase [Acidobacteriota bacterium]